MTDDDLYSANLAPLNPEFCDIVSELQQDEPEIVEMTEARIVEKYDNGQAHIIIQRNDFLVPSILEMTRPPALASTDGRTWRTGALGPRTTTSRGAP